MTDLLDGLRRIAPQPADEDAAALARVRPAFDPAQRRPRGGLATRLVAATASLALVGGLAWGALAAGGGDDAAGRSECSSGEATAREIARFVLLPGEPVPLEALRNNRAGCDGPGNLVGSGLRVDGETITAAVALWAPTPVSTVTFGPAGEDRIGTTPVRIRVDDVGTEPSAGAAGPLVQIEWADGAERQRLSSVGLTEAEARAIAAGVIAGQPLDFEGMTASTGAWLGQDAPRLAAVWRAGNQTLVANDNSAPWQAAIAEKSRFGLGRLTEVDGRPALFEQRAGATVLVWSGPDGELYELGDDGLVDLPTMLGRAAALHPAEPAEIVLATP